MGLGAAFGINAVIPADDLVAVHHPNLAALVGDTIGAGWIGTLTRQGLRARAGEAQKRRCGIHGFRLPIHNPNIRFRLQLCKTCFNVFA